MITMEASDLETIVGDAYARLEESREIVRDFRAEIAELRDRCYKQENETRDLKAGKGVDGGGGMDQMNQMKILLGAIPPTTAQCGKLLAIKSIRSLLGCGLKEAKDLSEIVFIPVEDPF